MAVPPNTTGPAFAEPVITMLSVTVGELISILISRPILFLITKSPKLFSSALKPGSVVVVSRLISSTKSGILVEVNACPLRVSTMLLPGLL